MAEYQKGDITNAKIIKLDDGYHVDNNGVIGDVLKRRRTKSATFSRRTSPTANSLKRLRSRK